ncbi:MAG: glycoside hydrolase family protein [Planctomycetota bacterium]
MPGAAARRAVVVLAAALLAACATPVPGADDLDFAALLQPIPGHVTRDGDELRIDSPSLLRDGEHHVWGGSVVRGEDGRYHMFCAMFDAGPGARKFGDEWLFSSVIAHASSAEPDRGYSIDGVLLRGRAAEGDPDAFDAQGVHNPHVVRDGDGVHLFHIGSRDPGAAAAGPAAAKLRTRDRIQQSQCIGVVHATSVEALVAGRYERPREPLLTPRTRVKPDNVVAPSSPGTAPLPDNLIVVNPSVVRAPDGRVLLYFKGNVYDPRWRGVHGVAIGDSMRGPIHAGDDYVFDVRLEDGRIASAEDPFVWFDASRRRFYALVKDFSGRLTGAAPGLALLTSADGMAWQRAQYPLASAKQLRFADGTVLPVQNLERPQLLFDDHGQPIALFCACIVGDGYRGHACNVQIPLVDR